MELYNIRKDPEEKYDLFFSEPEKVQELLIRLAEYNRTAVPVEFPPGDRSWDPRRGPGGALGPWM